MICKGAAISVVHNLQILVKRGMDKAIIDKLSNETFKKVLQPSVEKAYKLLVSGKNKKEVIKVLEADYMKFDDKIIFQGLLKTQNN